MKARVASVVAASALLVSGCGSDNDPAPSGSSPGPSGTAVVVAAECGLLEAAVTAVTAAHPDGVGLSIGAIPTEDQVGALDDLVTGLEEVDLTSGDLEDLRRAIVVASQSIIDRGSAAEPLTSDDQAVWAGSLTAASDYCSAVTAAPSTTPPVGTPAT